LPVIGRRVLPAYRRAELALPDGALTARLVACRASLDCVSLRAPLARRMQFLLLEAGPVLG
jgi:hypothetical protein